MSQYGLIYRLADYVGRCLPARTESEKGLFAHKVIALLKQLDNLQENNPSITLTVWAGDGIWVTYDGCRLFLILPRKSDFRVLYDMSPKNRSFSLHKILMKAAKEGSNVEDVRRGSDYRLWSVGPDEGELIIDFLTSLPVMEPESLDVRHPRYFSSQSRQRALEIFERGGRWCPGTKNRAKHKVDKKKERVEFDHILPHAAGGSRSELNIQVLCDVCNRLKRATAL